MNIAAELRNAVIDNFVIDKRLVSDAAYVIEMLGEENGKLRELVRDMWRDGMCECDERGACAECEYHFTERLRELGIEVEV